MGKSEHKDKKRKGNPPADPADVGAIQVRAAPRPPAPPPPRPRARPGGAELEGRVAPSGMPSPQEAGGVAGDGGGCPVEVHGLHPVFSGSFQTSFDVLEDIPGMELLFRQREAGSLRGRLAARHGLDVPHQEAGGVGGGMEEAFPVKVHGLHPVPSPSLPQSPPTPTPAPAPPHPGCGSSPRCRAGWGARPPSTPAGGQCRPAPELRGALPRRRRSPKSPKPPRRPGAGADAPGGRRRRRTS